MIIAGIGVDNADRDWGIFILPLVRCFEPYIHIIVGVGFQLIFGVGYQREEHAVILKRIQQAAFHMQRLTPVTNRAGFVDDLIKIIYLAFCGQIRRQVSLRIILKTLDKPGG